MNKNDRAILFEDSINVGDTHGLVGEISIYRRNKITGEKVFHEKSTNVISISGYQWILMKMFGLYLDSYHGPGTDAEDMDNDSTIIIPDLNNDDQMRIGINPDDYTEMNTNISATHFIQGFMIGNGGSAEDAITAKNTNYAFTRLRNAIPFRETTDLTALSPTEANKYLGIHRPSSSSNNNVKAYYIKKFDEIPHIYHSWWKDGERWDYVDPVTQDDLGPGAPNGQGKTNRIESYAECHLSIDENDCVAYFNHDGNTGTAQINELGLVAYDAIPGAISVVERLYDTHVQKIIKLIFGNTEYDAELIAKIQQIAFEINEVLTATLGETITETHIAAFMAEMSTIVDTGEGETIDFNTIKDHLRLSTNIEVNDLYHLDEFVYATDKFKEYADTAAYSISEGEITDEAQRIKLITYYTFNALPIQSDWEILIYYRIYAN
jgi:hypothetical protein